MIQDSFSYIMHALYPPYFYACSLESPSSNISPQAIFSIFISPRYLYFFHIVTEDGYCTVAEMYDCFFNNLASVRQV